MARVSGKLDDQKVLGRLGTAIRARRRALNLSQESLADAAGVDRSHMGKIERGERNVTTLLMIAIALALRTSASTIFHEAGL